jgi:uncharacterized phage infection (PIP) family protein YhgE
MRRGAVSLLLCAGMAAVFPMPLRAQAADVDIEALQSSVALYAGVLQEGLGLNVRAGIFSPLSGSVRGMYLAQQGVVLEVMSPLAGSRNSFTEYSLGAALERLSSQFSSLNQDSSGAVPRPDLTTLRESIAMSMRVDLAQGPARELLDELARIDASAEITAALQRSADAARSLHAMSQLDDAGLNAVLDETAVQGSRVAELAAAVQSLRTELSTQAMPAVEARLQELRASVQALATALEPLQAAALAQAQSLQEQASQARLRREQQWQQELADFEATLVRLVCDYSGGLRELPPEEFVTVVMKGLGDDTSARREDRIIVLRQSDALRCLQREITVQQLQSTARVYSF